MAGLMDYLPAILGVAGGAMGLPTWEIGLGTGALSAAKSGNLMQGLTAGLMAGGLGSLTSGLMQPGVAALPASAGISAGAGAGGVTAADTAAGMIPQGASSAYDAFGGAMAPGQATDAYGLAQQGGMGTLSTAAGAANPTMGPAGQSMWQQLTSGGASPADLSQFASNYKPALYATGLGGLGYLGSLQQQKQSDYANAQNASSQAANAQNQNLYNQYMAQAKKMNPNWDVINAYAATGGLMGDKGLSEAKAGDKADGDRGLYTRDYGPPEMSRQSVGMWTGANKDDITRGVKANASDSASHDAQQWLNNKTIAPGSAGVGAQPDSQYYATGALVGDNGRWEPQEANGIEGLLSGPGDGMSDHIPAHIEGQQPARLSTDEFVIPADVVSHLGNGSSSAGAKVLYTMLDKIREARQGHPHQGNEIEPDKYLPR